MSRCSKLCANSTLRAYFGRHTRTRRAARRAVLLFALGGVLCCVAAARADWTWTGTGGAPYNWGDPNWTTTAPGTGSSGTLTFGGSLGTTNNNNLLSFTCSGMTFSSTASSFNLGGSTINLTGSIGILNQSGYTQTVTANILLGATQNMGQNLGGTGDLIVSGIIGDGGNNYGINKVGSGTLVLSTHNTYAGPTTVNGGTLRLQALTAPVAGQRLLARCHPGEHDQRRQRLRRGLD